MNDLVKTKLCLKNYTNLWDPENPQGFLCWSKNAGFLGQSKPTHHKTSFMGDINQMIISV